MKVSVVIPLYNKKAYLPRALESVLSQTHQDLEVLVVNDGSTDGGEEMVRTIRDPRLRLISQANGGPGSARNRGIALASGEILAFLDADDEWLPTFLERNLSLLEQFGEGVACISSGYWLWPGGRSTVPMWRKRGLTPGIHRLGRDTPPLFAVYLLAYQSPCTTLIRTGIARRHGGFYQKGKCLYGEDAYFWLKVLLNEKMAVNLEPLTRIHQEASALSQNLAGPRPLGPILYDCEELYTVCPEHLSDLLRNILALRAMKAASILGYWGRWREGRQLLRKFCSRPTLSLPRFGLAQVCASPVGAAAGLLFRSFRRALRVFA